MDKSYIIPKLETTALLFIDMQEKLLNAMPENITETIKNQKILLGAAALLKLKVIVTEQYPKGLGSTAADLADIFDSKWPVVEKNTFSCMGEPSVRAELEKQKIETVVVAGIETHVCVLQTALDCMLKGYSVILLTDAVNSRKENDKLTAFKTAESAGITLMTVESLLFMLMRTSRHPAFREISRLLR